MKKLKVAVVILNYKGWRDTVNCLKALRRSTYKNYQIILIDNGSHDESVEKLDKVVKSGDVWLKKTKNHGFAGGVNIGIRHAIKNGFDAVALLNNDAQVEPDWLENLVTAMQKTKAAIVTGLLLSADGKTIDDAGDQYTTWGVPLLRAEHKPAAEAPESGYVFGSTGGATLYKTALFKDIGLFDEVFFAYNEDVDIDWRAQLAGYKIWYEKSAVAYHKHSATSQKMPGFTVYQIFKNLPLVLWKNLPRGMFLATAWRLFVAELLLFGHKILSGDGWPALKGIIKSWTLLPHALRERRRIQATKTVSNDYLKSLIYDGLPMKSVQRLRRFFGLKPKKW
ncbi:MAG: glycosyltransferase family 2 protein [Candidatus Nomurabacteria bacterium]|jgi:GT2 family glycosyltransferase|nr:glycosyltransferase family 2 protein [Candidatus Nomurabacteria bacterium]